MQSSTLTPTYTDFNDINGMRAQARVDPQSSLKQVAKQFEGIFIQMMLKSMRDASMGDDIFDSDQSKLYRDMFDKQISLDMANGKGIGIADALVRQLGKNEPSEENPTPTAMLNSQAIMERNGNLLPVSVRRAQIQQVLSTDHYNVAVSANASSNDKNSFASAEEFTSYILPFAEKAADELGVSPLVLVSQAALETGWGKAVIRRPDGESSFNLFNIKADNRWDGGRVTKSTLEYDNGVARYEKAAFRAYDSYADSFDDYVDFIRENNRYHDALQHNGNDELYIEGIHKAGYATDPNYSNKVIDILQRQTEQAQADLIVEESIERRGTENGHV